MDFRLLFVLPVLSVIVLFARDVIADDDLACESSTEDMQYIDGKPHDSASGCKPFDNSSHPENHLDLLSGGVHDKKLLSLGYVRGLVVEAFGPEIIEIEVEQESNTWIYEFKVIAANGRLLEVYVDASTGEILKVEND